MIFWIHLHGKYCFYLLTTNCLSGKGCIRFIEPQTHIVLCVWSSRPLRRCACVLFLLKGTIQWSDENWYMVYFSPLIMNINFKNSFSTPIPLKIAPKAQNLVLLMTEKWSTVPHWKLRNDQRFQIDYWETINGSRLNTEKRSTAPDWLLRNDQRLQIENWETINDVSGKWYKKYIVKHHWSFLSIQSGAVDRFSVFNLEPLIVSQYSIWNHWSFLSIQSGTIDHFSVFNVAPLIISQSWEARGFEL